MRSWLISCSVNERLATGTLSTNSSGISSPSPAEISQPFWRYSSQSIFSSGSSGLVLVFGFSSLLGFRFLAFLLLFLRLDEFVLFVEQRILHDLLLEHLLELDGGHLQQLERLLELRRHDELLPLPQVQSDFHFHANHLASRCADPA